MAVFGEKEANQQVKVIQKQYQAIKKIFDNTGLLPAVDTRAVMESAVTLFCLSYFGFCKGEKFVDKIKQLKDACKFNAFIVSDINAIREIGNLAGHNGYILDLDLAKEMFDRLQKCLLAIGKVLKKDLLCEENSEIFDFDKFCQQLRSYTQQNGTVFDLTKRGNYYYVEHAKISFGDIILLPPKDEAVLTIENRKLNKRFILGVSQDNLLFSFYSRITVEINAIIEGRATRTPGNGILTSPLIRNYAYSGVAQENYDDGCRLFGWDSSVRGKYGRQRRLYSYQNTKEKYSVWFLSNSNLNGVSNDKWKNIVSGDYSTITEIWKEESPNPFEQDIRLTFAKKDGHYYFLGVYKLKIDALSGKTVLRNGNVWERQFVCISDKYPQ